MHRNNNFLLAVQAKEEYTDSFLCETKKQGWGWEKEERLHDMNELNNKIEIFFI